MAIALARLTDAKVILVVEMALMKGALFMAGAASRLHQVVVTCL